MRVRVDVCVHVTCAVLARGLTWVGRLSEQPSLRWPKQGAAGDQARWRGERSGLGKVHRPTRRPMEAAPTRYLPPALRKPDGGGEIGLANDCARSLGDVASVGRRVAGRFLDAALFLLTTTVAPSTATTETSKSVAETSSGSTETATAVIGTSLAIENASIKGQVQEHGEERRRRGVHASDDDHPALRQRLVRSVARAAKEQLGCGGCRPLFREPAPHHTDLDEETRSNSGGGEGSRESSSSEDHGAWWAKLRLREQGWAEEVGREATAAVGHRKGESWVGIELFLRPCDVGDADGQTAIVEFLKGRVGEQWADDDLVEPPAKAQKETHRKGGEAELPAKVAAPVMVAKAVAGRGEEPCSSPDGGGGGGGSGSGDGSGRKGNGSDGVDESDTKNDGGAHGEDRRRGRAEGAATTTTTTTKVVIAVLIFGSELSKRDRAELHRHAEKAGGVASSSLGVGPARFLTLTCGLGGIGAAVELKLSAEQAELARSLFRLAQQQYHSRYECLSHREIREIVALGGPTAKDHPDLFKLVQESHKIGTTKSMRNDVVHRAGPSGMPEGGVNAKGKRQQSTVTELSPVEHVVDKKEVSDREGEAVLTAAEKCPW
eukprot:jgi/Undpi1/6266/HiC_scaffold_20.g08750.m1